MKVLPKASGAEEELTAGNYDILFWNEVCRTVVVLVV